MSTTQGKLSATYTITIDRDAGPDTAEGWQPVERHYSKAGRMFRPATITTDWKWEASTKGWSHNGTTITGPMTRADGSDGSSLANSYYRLDELPEWAHKLVSQAGGMLPNLRNAR